MISQFTVKIDGKSIAVKGSGSGGDAIIFIHGNSMSAETWLPQLNNDELQKRYRLLAIDLPGHGNSQRCNDAKEYRLQNLVNTTKQLIASFKVNRFLLVGLSYGTNIIGEMIPPLQDCVGIMLVSACIVNDKFPPADILTLGSYAHLIVADSPADEELKEYIRFGTSNEEVGKRYYITYRNTDPAFRKELGNLMMPNALTDELDNIAKWQVPVCVVFGKDEKLVKNDYLDNYPPLWNNKAYKIANAGHMVNEENAEEFDRVLIDFAAAVFK